jgi:anti-anti-sigma factor
MQLTIEDTEGLRLVRVSGELDTFAARGFREKLSHPRSSDRFVVDLAGLTFVDSAGLHALFGVSRTARDIGARLVFVVPVDSPVRKVVELVRLADVAPVCPTLDDAVARAGPDE